MFPLKPKQVNVPKNKTRNAEAHTEPAKFGMGDHYGMGYKNPMGVMRDASVGFRPVTRKQMGTPPKSVV